MAERKKRQVLIRVPDRIDRLLEEEVAKIGIPKSAFILNLIYLEFERREKERRQDQKVG